MFWVWRCYGLLWTLHCHKDRYCDVTMIWPLLFYGIRADVSETPNNALTTRMHGDYRPSIDIFFVGFNAICYAFLRNNPIYIEGRNCSFSTVPVFKGLRPVLEGFVVPMHEGACETGSHIPRALARGIWLTVRTSPSALGQQTPTDRS